MPEHLRTIFILALLAPACAQAGLCDDFRRAIDEYTQTSAAGVAVNDALDAARDGKRAALASRRAVEELDAEAIREIVRGADAVEAVESADRASAANIEAFDTVYTRVREYTAGLAKEIAAAREGARTEADEAATRALDSLSKLRAIARKSALTTASAAAGASPGATTSRVLIAVYENIFRLTCKEARRGQPVKWVPEVESVPVARDQGHIPAHAHRRPKSGCIHSIVDGPAVGSGKAIEGRSLHAECQHASFYRHVELRCSACE